MGRTRSKFLLIVFFVLLIVGCTTTKEVTIHFDSQGGESVEDIIVIVGETIESPTATRTGYTFEGWYTSSDQGVTLDEKWIFESDLINEEITLYANWVINQYTISFVTNGGTEVASITQDYDSDVSKPENPTKEEKEFYDWYIDQEFSTQYVFDKMPANDIILYAKWVGNQTLIVGAPDLSGNFMAGFGTNVYDHWVRELINGYNTYTTTPLGDVVLNETVVKTLTTSVDSGTGNKTYTFTLHEDLLWSDNEPLTAKDFVFSVLMQASKEWANVGATSIVGQSLYGYSEYNSSYQSADLRFKGVKLLGEYSFSLTIDGSKTPYYYETLYVSVIPYPMHVLAPEGTTIDSNSDGAKVGADNFSLLPVAAGISGYRYQPYVSAGPYKFVSFANQVVSLEKDENFKGNYLGKTPVIQNIVIKKVDQATNVDQVISGEIDLVTGVIESAKIFAASAAGSARTQYYSRNGYFLLAMQAHFGPTTDYKVRQAIAYLTDRQYVADASADGFGSYVYSEYSQSQWMYMESKDWIHANINKYTFSIGQANAALDLSAYKYESNGTTPFNSTLATSGSNYFRHNAAGERLIIRHFGINNEVTNSLRDKYEMNMQLAGIKYEITIGDYATLLDHYYYSYELDLADKKYHIFNLSTNFSVTFDPYYSWHSDWLGTWRNAHQLEDSIAHPAAPLLSGEKTLDELVVAMRRVSPGDTATYLALWREYQQRWNKLIPNVPLYSNQYYDVYDAELKGVETTPFWSWAAAINDMYFE